MYKSTLLGEDFPVQRTILKLVTRGFLKFSTHLIGGQLIRTLTFYASLANTKRWVWVPCSQCAFQLLFTSGFVSVHASTRLTFQFRVLGTSFRPSESLQATWIWQLHMFWYIENAVFPKYTKPTHKCKILGMQLIMAWSFDFWVLTPYRTERRFGCFEELITFIFMATSGKSGGRWVFIQETGVFPVLFVYYF